MFFRIGGNLWKLTARLFTASAIKSLTPVPFPEATGQAEHTDKSKKNSVNSVREYV